MKTYLINLDRRSDRLDRMRQECQRLGIQFDRIAAVDGEDPAVAEEAQRCRPGRVGVRIHQNAYACFQSHRKCWRSLVSNGDDYAMILEDDVSISPDATAYLDSSWLPSRADIIKLETFGIRVHLSRSEIRVQGGRALRELRSLHPGSGGYILTKQAAQTLLEESEAVSEPVDRFLFDPNHGLLGTLNMYQITPALVVQGQRQPGTSSAASWISTSIPDRFSAGFSSREKPKTGRKRLEERIGEEIKALMTGSKYNVVPCR